MIIKCYLTSHSVFHKLIPVLKQLRAFSSVGRASRLHRGGRGFESLSAQIKRVLSHKLFGVRLFLFDKKSVYARLCVGVDAIRPYDV